MGKSAHAEGEDEKVRVRARGMRQKCVQKACFARCRCGGKRTGRQPASARGSAQQGTQKPSFPCQRHEKKAYMLHVYVLVLEMLARRRRKFPSKKFLVCVKVRAKRGRRALNVQKPKRSERRRKVSSEQKESFKRKSRKQKQKVKARKSYAPVFLLFHVLSCPCLLFPPFHKGVSLFSPCLPMPFRLPPCPRLPKVLSKTALVCHRSRHVEEYRQS